MQEKHERQISGVHKGRTPGNRGRRSEDGNDPLTTGGVTARTYSKEEWSKLTNEERTKIKELRKARKASNRGRGNTTDTRNASAVQLDGLQSTHSHDDPVSEDSDGTQSRVSASEDDDYVPTGPPTRRTGKSVRHN